MTTTTKNRWLTRGFWGVAIAGVWASTSGAWVLGLLGVLLMSVLDQCQEEEP